MTMRKTIALLTMTLLAAQPALAGQDPRIPQAEQDADKIEADAMYARQRQRDQAEVDRVAKTNLGRQGDYDLYLAKQKADYDAKMAAWRAENARIKAEYEARVAKCVADKTCAPR
jgi:hypothetical protein